MKHRTRSLLLLIAAAMAGCSQPVQVPQRLDSEKQDRLEPDFATQLSAVRASQRDRIHIETQPIGDDQLQSLAGTEGLEVLLLDHPTNPISEPGFAAIASLPNLMHLRLRGVPVDEEAAAQLSKAAELQILNLPQAELSDAALTELRGLDKLVQLRIGSSQLTDKGLEALQNFPNLKRVHLIDVPITDEGIEVFEKLPKLQSLYIDGGKVSDAGYDRLFKAKPKLHVHVDQAHHDRDPHAHRH